MVPLTLVTIVLLLYANTKSAVKAGIVMMAVPFSVVGAVRLMYALGYNVSIAAWVGMIALMGLVYPAVYLLWKWRSEVRRAALAG